MKISVLYEDESAPVVEISGVDNSESEGMENAKSVVDMESAADSSVDAPSSVADSSLGGASAPGDDIAPLAPDPAVVSSQLGDASLADSSQVTDESDTSEAEGDSELEDTSEVTEDDSMSDARLLLSTPLDTYTVTEGLLLLAVIFLALGGAIALFRGR